MPETNSNPQVEALHLQARQSGTFSIFQAAIQEHGAHMTMGSYRTAAELRSAIHDRLDAWLDAVENSTRFTRKTACLD